MIARPLLKRFGDLISVMGSPEFGNQFYRIFADTLDVEECTVFTFPTLQQANHLVSEGCTEDIREKSRHLALDYVAGDFRFDPNFRRWVKAPHAAVYLARPQSISNREYRQHYYESNDIAHELVMLGQIDNRMYYSSFYRCGHSSSFDDRDVSMVESVSSVLLKMLFRHDQLTRSHAYEIEKANLSGAMNCEANQPQQAFQRTINALMSGKHGLSRREAEVCGSVMLGYSTAAIAQNLGIKTHTVITHRKRGYAKLEVCSKNELFVRYFATVNEMPRLSS